MIPTAPTVDGPAMSPVGQQLAITCTAGTQQEQNGRVQAIIQVSPGIPTPVIINVAPGANNAVTLTVLPSIGSMLCVTCTARNFIGDTTREFCTALQGTLKNDSSHSKQELSLFSQW